MEEELYDFHKNQQFSHWWFKGRNKVIEAFLRKEIKNTSNDIIDIGAGFGVCIPILKKFGKVDAIEPYEKAHLHLKELGVNEVYNITNFPKEIPGKKYDIVTFFDVIEHIENDSEVVKAVKNDLLKPSGNLIITVPAYMWLWTKHDELNMHYRRYTKTSLKKLLQDAGYKNIRISYYMTFLFPLAIIDRLLLKLRKNHSVDGTSKPAGIINSMFETFFYAEAPLVARFNLPFGLSLIAKADVEA